MKRFSSFLGLLSIAFLILGFGQSAYAQTSRTWVSALGSNINPCTQVAPCRTFDRAINMTAAGGEINAMDDGDFGTVTIRKALTINGGGHLAGVLVSGTGVNGIIVNAGVSDAVVLRGLTFTGVNSGGGGSPFNAVRYLAGGYLVVENSTITGYTNGINLTSLAVNGRLDIRNVTMTNTAGLTPSHGIFVGAANSIVTIRNATARGFTYGIRTGDGQTYMRDSDMVGNMQPYLNGGGTLFSYGDNMFSGGGATDTPGGSITRY